MISSLNKIIFLKNIFDMRIKDQLIINEFEKTLETFYFEGKNNFQ